MKRKWPFRLSEAIILAILFVLVVSAPLLGLMGKFPEFLAARATSRWNPLILALVLSLLFPILVAIPSLFRSRFSIWYFRFWTVLLIALFTMTGLRSILDFWWTPLMSVIFGVGFVLGCERYSLIRSFLLFLFPAFLVVPAQFLMNPFIAKLLKSEQAAVMNVKLNPPPAIVFVIFDEFSAFSIMDDGGQVDAVRYPGFSRLAARSTWFRNATSVCDFTTAAVPALLDGRYAQPDTLPILIDHPCNLFTLLRGHSRINAREIETKLNPGNVQNETKTFKNITAMLKDLSAVYLHLVLPERLSNVLPPVTQNWGSFWPNSKEASPPEIFREFIKEIVPAQSPVLYFIHSHLPHVPWEYLPSGKSYVAHGSGRVSIDGLDRNDTWTDNEDVTVRGLQRYLLQLGYVDRLIQELLDRLERTGMMDDTLLIVTADHGVSFHGGMPRRELKPYTWGDLAGIPMFIKYPGQRESRVTDRMVQTIDILPTILAVCNSSQTVPLDGKPLTIESSSVEDRHLYLYTARSTFVVPPQPLPFTGGLKRMIDEFGAGTPIDELSPKRYQSEWLGRDLKDSRVISEDSVRIELNGSELEDVDPRSSQIPVMISGRVLAQTPTARNLLICLNGTIRAMTRSFLVGSKLERFTFIVPETVFRPGRNEPDILLPPEQPNQPLRKVAVDMK